MLNFLLGFIISSALTLVVLLTNKYHQYFSHDHDLDSVQKYHTEPTPRIGGFAIFISFVIVMLINHFMGLKVGFDCNIVLGVLAVFIIGIMEDFTKKVTPLVRMLVLSISAIWAMYLTHTMISYADFSYLEKLIVLYPIIGIALSWFCIVGLTNSYNIIDGYNGLASTTAIINLIGLAFIAHSVGDLDVFRVSLVLLSAILGFLVFNYPWGKIFLGDGGVYTIGFIIALISIHLVHVHKGLISPYAVLLMATYPVTEMGFSMYRRKFIHRTRGMQPDNMHLHQMVYHNCTPNGAKHRNAMVLPCMLFFIIPPVFLATLFYRSTLMCLIFICAYVVFYVTSYFKIVRFKTYKFMQFWL